jgi:Fe-S cluster assembly iron-binding protein IscA
MDRIRGNPGPRPESNGYAIGTRISAALPGNRASRFRATPHDAVIRQAPWPDGERPRARVDFVGTRPYRRLDDRGGEDAVRIPIVLTPKAVEMVRTLRAKEGLPDTHARYAWRWSGRLLGFSYQMSFAEQAEEGDRQVEYDGVRVLVDATSAQYLAGRRSISSRASTAAGSSSRTRRPPTPAAAAPRSRLNSPGARAVLARPRALRSSDAPDPGRQAGAAAPS